MNRHRFSNPTSSFINEGPINPNNYTTIPRFNVWQSTLSNNQPGATGYAISQIKKNYCSACDMWTSEPYNNHQISPAHLAKKSSQRSIVQNNYQTSHGSSNSSSNNVNNAISNNNNNNNSTSKRKFKRSNRRGNQNNRNKQVSDDSSVDRNESILNDDRVNETTVLSADEKSKIIVSSQSKESDKKLNDVTKNRGQEMLIPVNGVFCALCEVFFANKETAENEHCSSQTHCDAYEKLLKRAQESKSDKRPNENPSDSNLSDGKRLKLTENKDRDFRVLAIQASSATKDEDHRFNIKKDKESDDADQNSTTEFNAPDFSLEFPDDIEDYDEGEVQMNSEKSSSNDNRQVCVVSKDA